MKRVVLMLTLLFTLSAFANKKQDEDFPLQVHVIDVDMSGNWNGGQPILHRIFTLHIDGDGRELAVTPEKNIVEGNNTRLEEIRLHLGSDYRGHWNRNGTLEIQYLDENGKLKHAPFAINAEHLISK